MITTKNDGKGKYQNCEAKLNGESDNNDGSGWYNFEIEAYGATEQDATNNLLDQLQKMVNHLLNERDKEIG